MDRKIVLTILTAALFAFIGIWLLLSLFPDERAGLRLYPWDVSTDEAGHTRVFGLTLGQSTLNDVRAILGEEGTLNLFAEPDGHYDVEAYFDNILLSNLKADWVISIDVPQAMLAAMYDRGLRVSKVGSGSHKVKLAPQDVAPLLELPVRTITYLPWKSLESRDIEGNFGTPERQLTEPGGVVHWLYPGKGMDIARDPDGGVVIQYLNPAEFARALTPRSTAGSAGD